MSKDCIISFASKGREDYNKAMTRNITELKARGYEGDFIYYSLDDPRNVAGIEILGGLPKGCDPHKVTPYQFKPKLFKEAFDKGYTRVIWTDSTIVAARHPKPVFDEASKRGVVAFHNLGHNLNKWISDKAAQNLGFATPLPSDVYQIMACVIAIDYANPTGKKIFDKWLKLSEDGESFKDNKGSAPGFVNHRHDQAVLSGLLWLEGVKLLPYGSLVYEPHNQPPYEYGDKFYFVNKAI